MEKETLYTACLNYSIYNEQIKLAVQSAIEFGANWQRQQSYTEEQVLEILEKRLWSVGIKPNKESTEIWFNQFKKH